MNLWQVGNSFDSFHVYRNTATCCWSETHSRQYIQLIHTDAADLILNVHLWNCSTKHIVSEIGPRLFDDIEIILSKAHLVKARCNVPIFFHSVFIFFLSNFNIKNYSK